jgi:rhodanese-related sulfurtransferase
MAKGIFHINSQEAWDLLSHDRSAMLVDVRTREEWAYTGYPVLSSVGKKIFFISWLEFPHMDINPNFIKDLQLKIANKSDKVLFICRSGGRSAQAAEYANNNGYENCYNISDGFEGDINTPSKHRNEVNGWKFNNLPWEQT